MIPIFVGKALAGEPLTIAGDGLQTRRFVYVEDLAEGIVRGLQPQAANRVYNLASNQTVTIRGLADVVGEVVGSAEIVHTPGRNGDFGGVEISNVRAMEELGWSADTPLEEGVSRYLDWLREASSEELEPAPPVTPVATASTAIAAAAPAEAATRRRAGERFPIGTWAVAVAFGTLLAALLSVRTDDFGTGQTSTVVFVALIAIVASLSSRRPWSGALAWGLTGLYVVLMIFPASHHALNLAIPHVGTLVLGALAAVVALGVAAASDRIPASETVTEPGP